ncbi:MAG: carbonic anhydrase [Verrucomicrobia bacterium]|nr:MAG: carbonic anhydrase [Verrucomicrobiota bacterium]
MKSHSSIRHVAIAAILLCLPFGIIAKESEHAPKSKISPAKALELLKAGNQRFVAGKLEHPRQTAKRRTELATGQQPFAVVLGCADSRTAPEVLFDQGLGDVFVIRVAGNVLNDETIGSIEYAVDHLGAPLIVVLGHERCGAIAAARDTIAAKTEAPGHIQSLVRAIAPVVEATSALDAEATAKANEMHVAEELRNSEPLLKEMIGKGEVTVVAAHYDLDTGAVEFLK